MSDSLSNDYNLLTTKGNIGFYNSCETTEIFIFDRVNSTIFNLYTISVFQEKHTSKEKYKNRTPLTSNRIEINDRYFIGILQYELELDEIRENFDTLNNNEIWISNHNKNSSKNYSDLKKLNKQFIPSNEESRINLILKNNYFSGSYILEFFDENKNFDFLIEDDELFEGVSNEILEYIPINLYQVKDRLGNFIFQFPVTIVNIDVSSSDSWDSVDFKFYWNPKIEEIPDCHLDICSILDNNYLGFSIEEYNKKDVQTVYTGNSDSSNIIKVWNDNSNLLLFSCTEHFTKYIELSVGISVNEYRYFGNDGETESINLISKDLDTWHEREYTDYINESTNRIEKEKLEENLSFKIYDKGKRKEGLKDLRTLINKHGKYGVYLWDPYLRVKDIINTLFYCEFKDVPLKALCSAKQNIRQNYTKQTVKKEFEELQEIINSNKENEVIINDIKTKTLTMNSYLNSYGTTEHIQKLKNECDSIESNFKGLNITFMVEKEKSIHDRFLIFPGNHKTYTPPKVYSLGTSVNSFGNNYHILQEVSNPQIVLSEFDRIWEKLNEEENLIWKYPK